MIQRFLESLKHAPPGAVFNPWWDYCAQTDCSREAPRIRRRQLRDYLLLRKDRCRMVLVAEALGYQGGRFTGIPMTSERILCTPGTPVTLQRPAQRTSRASCRKDGFAEPTATFIWRTLKQTGHDPDRVILWNAFPWHPFDPQRGPLSNRPLTVDERRAGLPVLRFLLEQTQPEKLVAVGRQAAATLAEMDRVFHPVRHPSRGGAGLFQQQMSALCAR